MLFRRCAISMITLCVFAGVATADSNNPNRYVVTPLTSNQPTLAPIQDPVLQNAWGVAFTPGGSPFWIADNATGCSTLYDGKGVVQSRQVKIPLPSGQASATSCKPVLPNTTPTNAAPTGMVWNPASGFLVPGTQISALFIWATEDGTISAWAPTIPDPTQAVLAVDNSTEGGVGAVYKGLVFGVNPQGMFLYATDFRNAKIDVFAPQPSGSNGSFQSVSLSSTQIPGSFSDPNIPAGFAPFGIQSINGNLYVTYAKQDQKKHDDVAGKGNGFVDIFDTSGNLIGGFASQGTLNSPWGVARASSVFGKFSGDILVGNFGDGRITAFGNDGTPHGLLFDAATNKPVSIDGLWTITLGGGLHSSPDVLYFTAGPNGETDGLFGTITPKN